MTPSYGRVHKTITRARENIKEMVKIVFRKNKINKVKKPEDYRTKGLVRPYLIATRITA